MEKITLRMYRYLRLRWVACSFLCLTACVEESIQMKISSTPRHIGIALQLEMPPALEVATRASAPLDGMTVNDIWVIQYRKNSSETDKMTIKSYSETEIGTALDTQTGLIPVTTTDTDFWNEDSDFYIIANAGTDHAGLKALTTTSTLEDLQTLVVNITQDADFAWTLMTAGPIAFKKRETGGVASEMTVASIVAPLKRAFAKITVSYSVVPEVFTNATFTVTSLTVENYPKIMAFYERKGTTNGAFPAMSEMETTTSASIIATTADGAATGETSPDTYSVSFYMGENLRGRGLASTAAGKNLASNGPSETSGSHSLNGCTRIVLEGEYQYDATYTGKVGVKYIFYLGENLVNDYNIQRGHHYILNITISGANSADARVTITDGSVVVFDKVTVINEIEVQM